MMRGTVLATAAVVLTGTLWAQSTTAKAGQKIVGQRPKAAAQPSRVIITKTLTAIQARDFPSLVDYVHQYRQEMQAIRQTTPQLLLQEKLAGYRKSRVEGLANAPNIWQDIAESSAAFSNGDATQSIRAALSYITSACTFSINEIRPTTIRIGFETRPAVMGYVLVQYPKPEYAPEEADRLLKATIVGIILTVDSQSVERIQRITEGNKYWEPPYPQSSVPAILQRYSGQAAVARSNDRADEVFRKIAAQDPDLAIDTLLPWIRPTVPNSGVAAPILASLVQVRPQRAKAVAQAMHNMLRRNFDSQKERYAFDNLPRDWCPADVVPVGRALIRVAKDVTDDSFQQAMRETMIIGLSAAMSGARWDDSYNRPMWARVPQLRDCLNVYLDGFRLTQGADFDVSLYETVVQMFDNEANRMGRNNARLLADRYASATQDEETNAFMKFAATACQIPVPTGCAVRFKKLQVKVNSADSAEVIVQVGQPPYSTSLGQYGAGIEKEFGVYRLTLAHATTTSNSGGWIFKSARKL